jgi:hypothetical protein
VSRRYEPFDRKVQRIVDNAIEESLEEVASAVTIRFGSPTQRLIEELGVYARHLRTWTCDKEDIGAVRPLRELLNDAALFITIHCNVVSAIAESDAPNE